MASAGDIPFNPTVLRWARERAAYSVPEVASRLKIKKERLSEWEAGYRKPTVRQGRLLAKIYDRPFLEFFGDDIPVLPDLSLIADYREGAEFGGAAQARYKRILQEWAESQRLNALDLFEMLGETPPELPTDFTVSIGDDVEVMAASMRRKFSFDISTQMNLRSNGRDQFPEILRRKFEAHGILVLRRNEISKFGIRGLCLATRPMPVIVYGGEAPSAQAFTLSHELGHVLLRLSGISGFDAHREVSSSETRAVENWRNKFAAAFLIPANNVADFIDLPREPAPTIEDVRLTDMAQEFSVSRHAMLIRLVSLGYVHEQFYWDVMRPRFREEEAAYKAGGRSTYYGSRYRRNMGDLYTSLVLEVWEAGQITNHSAAEFMGISNIVHLDKIREYFVS